MCQMATPARTVVYVDGFNLYYTARVSARPGNPGAPNDQQIYLRALRMIPNLTLAQGARE